ncbi:MAG: hypothetical protein JHD33_06890 [Chthoniobacterales bacterium]|nr:hypothetical protein [Chthoniobacterales bacterium]
MKVYCPHVRSSTRRPESPQGLPFGRCGENGPRVRLDRTAYCHRRSGHHCLSRHGGRANVLFGDMPTETLYSMNLNVAQNIKQL